MWKAVGRNFKLNEEEIAFIADKISKDFGELEHLRERLKEVEKQIKNKRK